MKKCSRCEETKSVTDFYRDKNKKDGHSSRCKVCSLANGIAWRIDNPEKSSAANRAWRSANKEAIRARNRVRMYGTDGSDLLKQQGGRCAICTSDLLAVPEKHRHIDHDHLTQTVRGWLCHWCNVGMGKFRDNAAHLRRAADYLENSNSTRKGIK